MNRDIKLQEIYIGHNTLTFPLKAILSDAFVLNNPTFGFVDVFITTLKLTVFAIILQYVQSIRPLAHNQLEPLQVAKT